MSTSTVTSQRIRPAAAPHMTAQLGPRLWHTIVAERWMYLFIVPGALYFLVFQYLPLLGNVIAFQEFSPFLGFFDSPWVGLDNFVRLFTDPDIVTVVSNTLVISLLQIIFAFPILILLALMFNALPNPAF